MNSLVLENCDVGYGKHLILKDFSLPALQPGAFVALVGANGCGKSTLLRSIAGLQSSKGRMMLGDEDLNRLPMKARVKRVAYLPQSLPQGNSLVAYESVLSANRALSDDLTIAEINQRISEVFTHLDLMDMAMSRLNQLSGGQRQMIGLAQILVRRPRLLLLDEPTSALDMRWQLKVLETVQEICQKDGAISLIAIHDINLALRFCTNIIVLAKGALQAAGHPDDVLTPDLLRRTYGVEARVETCSLGHRLVLADRALPI